jgi:DNA-binding transcriptional MerR regulator
MGTAPKNKVAAKKAAEKRLIKAGELARRTGLTRQALHMYVQLGLLRPSGSTKGGQRLFDEDATERVNLIRKLCASGYTLRDIRDIFIKDR